MEEKYYWVDIESGVRFECTKEYRDAMLSIWEAAKPKLNIPIGSVFITGTKGYDECKTNSFL